VPASGGRGSSHRKITAGDVVEILKIVLTYVLTVYLAVLIGYLILSWINMFVRPWYPPRVIKLVAEAIYSVTDPALKFLRRYIPSPRIGTVSLDLSFMVLFFVVLILLRLAVPRL
jgi:YggT family protein